MKRMLFRMTLMMVAMMLTMTTYAASGDDNNEVEEHEEYLEGMVTPTAGELHGQRETQFRCLLQVRPPSQW